MIALGKFWKNGKRRKTGRSLTFSYLNMIVQATKFLKSEVGLAATISINRTRIIGRMLQFMRMMNTATLFQKLLEVKRMGSRLKLTLLSTTMSEIGLLKRGWLTISLKIPTKGFMIKWEIGLLKTAFEEETIILLKNEKSNTSNRLPARARVSKAGTRFFP